MRPLLLVVVAVAQPPGCRCTPPMPCWAAVPWAALNTSVGGRLVVTQDELSSCVVNMSSPQCVADLASTDDEFWLSARPGGYLHTGQFGVWDIAARLPAYSVLATSEGDIQAAVAFAAAHNLRLVVKNTGHDWYARSAGAGSLMVWTHQRKSIVFDPAFVPEGSPPWTPVAAVTVDSGVQFDELFAAAQAARRFVVGGTCDSVGVGGCWLGGCFGSFSRLYGSAASNLLQARVVLANGTLVVANAFQHPDLFWALRGGGPGLGGVVTEFTARSYEPPAWVAAGSASFETDDLAQFTQVLEHALNYTKNEVVLRSEWSGYFGFYRSKVGGGYSVSVGAKGFNGDATDGAVRMQSLLDWAAAQPGVSHSSSWTVWNNTGQLTELPWMEAHPDREISTALVASLSRHVSLLQLQDDAGIATVAAAFAELTDEMPALPGFPFGIDVEKGQGGASATAQSLLQETAQNPVLLQSIGLLLVMLNVPDLPQLPKNAALLQAEWPRLQKYLFSDADDPLVALCEAGAAGDEDKAASCWSTINGTTLPSIRAAAQAMNATLLEAFPNVDPVTGSPMSGGYMHETDYHDPEWQATQWGATNYARLLQMKEAYDPAGLFTCHHCVGSEKWDEDGNCRIAA